MAVLSPPTPTDGSCPTCGEAGGFHNNPDINWGADPSEAAILAWANSKHKQARDNIPADLTWKPGEDPAWKRRGREEAARELMHGDYDDPPTPEEWKQVRREVAEERRRGGRFTS